MPSPQDYCASGHDGIFTGPALPGFLPRSKDNHITYTIPHAQKESSHAALLVAEQVLQIVTFTLLQSSRITLSSFDLCGLLRHALGQSVPSGGPFLMAASTRMVEKPEPLIHE